MLVKTILNQVEKFKSFVYGECTFKKIGNTSIIVEVSARKNARGLCDVSIAKYTASELSSSLGVMAKIVKPKRFYVFLETLAKSVVISKCA
jgi:hypothetical protein